VQRGEEGEDCDSAARNVTVSTGQFYISIPAPSRQERSAWPAEPQLVLQTGPGCVNAETGTLVRAPLRCASLRAGSLPKVPPGTPRVRNVCSILTDLHAELVDRWTLSSAEANSRLLIALRILPKVDLLTFDPTTLHEESSALRFASLRVLTAMRALEVWESQVTTLIVSKAQALRELRSPHEQPKLLNTVIGDVAAPISRRVRTLLAKTIYDVSEAPASWLPTTDVPPPEPPPTPPVSPPSPPAPLLVGIPAMARSRAAASRALVPDAPGAVRTSFSAMLGGGYQPGAPSPSPPSPSPPPPSPPPPPFWTLLAQSPPPPAMRSHATSLNLESSELLADLLATVAHQLNVSLPPEEVHVSAVAGTLLVRAMRVDESELLGRRARRSAAADADSVWASASLLSKWQQVGHWLGHYTVGLGTGHVSFRHFADATSPLSLAEHARNSSSLVRVGCLDPRAITYSPAGTMHRPAACMYTSIPLAAAFLQMDEVEWCYFGLTVASSTWLMVILCGVLAWGVRFRQLQRLTATPLERWPSVALIVPCYLPNEEAIVMETVRHMCSIEYAGPLRVVVVYNTPRPCAVQAELHALTELHGRSVEAHNVQGSSSKAHNLEYALTVVDEEVLVLFDADHQPCADCVTKLVTTLQRLPHVSAVQGAVLIDRGGPWLMRTILNAMEWSSWCIFSPGIAMLVGSGYFGGACAAWRPAALRQLGFDTRMQTEDIDLSIRALSLGHSIQMIPHAQSLEMCPVGLYALYRQRLRWALGWEEVTHVRLSSVFGSPKISEPRKWRVSILLMARYLTLFTSIFGVGQIVDGLFFSRSWPLPLRVAMSVPSLSCVFIWLFTAWMLCQLHAPGKLWASVFFFQLVSPVFFCMQSSLIVVASIRLALSGNKPMEWVATKRDAEYVPPEPIAGTQEEPKTS